MGKTEMTRSELSSLMVKLMEARAAAAFAQAHYEDLYHKLWGEIEQHYPIEPRN